MPIHDPARLAAILSHLRGARRHLAESAPGSPDSDRLAARVRDLEEEYRAAVQAELEPERERRPARRGG